MEVSQNNIREESDEEELTAAEVLRKVEELWITEKMSPTLEPHQEELVDCLMDQLTQMSNNLKKCKNNDLRVAFHKMEIDRIRYIISSYLRTRLQKIEKFVFHILNMESKRKESDPSLLSPAEYKYAKEYGSNIDVHMNSLVLQHMPENMRSLDGPKASVNPNLDAYVFFKVKKDVSGLLIEDNTGEGRDEEVDLEIGHQHLMRYSTISHLLKEDVISLI